MATEGVRQLLQELKDAKKEVHQKDVEDLMQSFVQLDATSFAAFKSLWVLRRFSFIFEGRPPQVPGREFMQNLYSASLGGLSSGSSLRQRCAAIYMLYALYFGQPFRPRVLIYLGLDKLRELQVAAAEFQEGEGGEDALAVLRALQEERALLFGAFSVDPPTVAEFMTQRLTDAGRAIRVMNSRLLGKLPVESHIGESLKGALPVQEATLAAAKYARALAAVEEVGGPEAAQLMAREPVLPAVLALARDFDTRREKLLAEVRQRAGTAAQEPLLVALECLARTGLKRTTASMNKKKKQKVEEGEAAETEAEAEAAVAQLEGQREPSEGEGSDLAFDEDMLAAELEAGMLEEGLPLRGLLISTSSHLISRIIMVEPRLRFVAAASLLVVLFLQPAAALKFWNGVSWSGSQAIDVSDSKFTYQGCYTTTNIYFDPNFEIGPGFQGFRPDVVSEAVESVSWANSDPTIARCFCTLGGCQDCKCWGGGNPPTRLSVDLAASGASLGSNVKSVVFLKQETPFPPGWTTGSVAIVNPGGDWSAV